MKLLSKKMLCYKIASLLLVFTLAASFPLALASCGGGDDTDTTTTTPIISSDTKENGTGNDTANNNDEEFVFVYNGVTIAMHAPADPIIAPLASRLRRMRNRRALFRATIITIITAALRFPLMRMVLSAVFTPST